MEEIESAITVHPNSIWHTENAPKFPVNAIGNTALASDRIIRAKRLIFGTVAEPEAEVTQLPPSQLEYPFVSSLNPNEWLSTGSGGPIPPDQDIILWDRSHDPARSVRSYVKLAEVTERTLRSAVYQGSVELRLKELCAVIEKFVESFDSIHDPDSVIFTIQAQPSLLPVLLNTKAVGNYQHLRTKVFGHAVLNQREWFITVTRATLNYFINNSHVVGFQETRFTGSKTFQRAKHLWQATSALNSSFWSQDNVDLYPKSAGIRIIITPACPVRELSDVTTSYVSFPDLLSRYLLIRETVDSVVTYIHVVYAPVHQGQRPQFSNSLPRHFAEDAHHIIMGDFNTVLSNQLDQSRSQEWSRRQGREELRDWMHELQLVDSWRLQHPNVQEFTSPTGSSRIDYVFVDYRLFHSQFQHIFHDFQAKSGIGDHIGLSFRLGSTNFKPSSRAPWKCPAWVIKLPEAQDYLQASLQQLAASFDPILEHYNPGCLLDEHKRRDSIFLRQLFHAKKNYRQREIELLHLAVNKLQHQQSFNPALDLSKDLSIAKAALQAMLEESAHFASKHKFASDIKASERCSKFFFRPTQIFHKTPISVDSAESLESTCVDFNTYWSGIFCSPSREYGHPKPQWDRIGLARILQHTTSRLSSADRAYLDSPLTAHDFFLAFKHMASGKTPGPDGLPLAYYSTDLPLWSRIYEVVYGDQFQKRRMTKFQRRAQISLLYKHGDRSVPSNYRPISLLNVDAKLGPKILAHRLGGVLSLLLHSDQYGFVPGRDIRHAHIRFQALTQLYSDSTSPVGAVRLDFAKAFDSVVWDALDMVLMHFDFSHNFCRWVKVRFPGTLASLMFNGRPLAPIELGAGVRQGDPLSPALFVLFIEPLLNLIRTKLQGLGLQSGPTIHTVISFAGDCTGLLHDRRHTNDFLNL